jgi:glycosyltransferase involved in cell wall biosynthesis
MRKGVDDFLRAANEIPECDFKIFGSMSEQVIRHVADIGCPSNVSILDKYLSEGDIMHAIAESNIVFAVYKGWSKSSNIQVLASGIGRPIVVNDEFYMADVVHNFGGGVRVKGGDVDSIAAGIRSILDTPQELTGFKNYADTHQYHESSQLIGSLLK